jgi:tetratricopeptide (TPR) repeat protein
VRELFDKARGTGWRALTVSATKLAPAYTITFNDKGQYAWARTLPGGVQERVVCDGKTLWHLYPELHLAAKRTVSGHHRVELADRVAQALPRPEDLARGASVERITPNVVAVVPQPRLDASGKPRPHVRTHYLFRDGKLTGRVWILMPARVVLAREDLADDVKEATDPPSLTPNVKKLLVLDLPHRAPNHLIESLKVSDQRFRELTFAAAKKLVAAYAASRQGEMARVVFQQALAERDQRHPGYYVLLASAGISLDSNNIDVLDAHPDDPLAQYLALYSSPVLRKGASQWATASNAWKDGILHRLSVGHALHQRWSSGRPVGTDAAKRKAERGRALAYVKQYAGTELAWGVLGVVQDRTAALTDKAERAAAFRELAAAYALFADAPGLGDFARYEQARCLWHAGAGEPARKRFLALLDGARGRGALLPIDGDFLAALRAGKGDAAWPAVMRREARACVKAGRRDQALLLAWQCWQLEDQTTARSLYAEAVQGVPSKDLPAQLSALSFLLRTNQKAEAERLVGKLLSDAGHARRPDLWRVASRLAGEQFKHARRLECLEKAVELEETSPTPVVNVEQFRADHTALLAEYESLAKSLVTLKLPPPRGFRDRIVRAADRWRAVLPGDAAAASSAASALRILGERELAWDYMTTRVAFRPGESDVWVGLAGELRGTGERKLADLAYEAAFEREGSNAQILWDRAENLREAGRTAAARQVYRQIAEGSWQPRFASLKEQAKWAMEGE